MNAHGRVDAGRARNAGAGWLGRRERTIDGHQALARVRADLGRDPQDRIEAAVALESSGGLAGRQALDLGRTAAHLARRTARWTPPRPSDRGLSPWTAPASVALVLVSLAWASLLASAPGGLDSAGVFVGLPVGLGLVGYLDRRYFAGDDGPVRTRAHAGAVVATVALPCAFVGLVAPIGAGVVLMLVCTALAARFRVAGLVITAVGGGLVASRVGVPAAVAAGTSLAVVTAGVLVAVLRRPVQPMLPGLLSLAVLRGLAGVGLGLLTIPVVDQTTAMATTAPLLVILPSTIGGAMAAGRLDQVWRVVPDLLDASPARSESDPTVRRSYTALVVSGAVVGFASTALLSLLSAAAVVDAQERRVTSILVAMAAVAAVGYAASVLHGVGAEVPVAVVLLGAGVGALLAVAAGGDATVVVVAAVVVAHLLWLPLLLQVIADPERLLAARL